MSVFDLFRGFFGVPGGHYGGRRDPFFDAMTRDEDDEDEDGFFYDGFRGDQQHPFDDSLRFGFSFGPNGMRFREPAMFGDVLREMEEMFSQLGRWEGDTDPAHFGAPRIMLPLPPQGRSERGGSSGNPLRDFMLKSPDGDPREPHSETPGNIQPSYESPEFPPSPFHGWRPFSKFNDIWRQEQKTPDEEPKEDRDLDSAVSSGGLDQILSPPAGQAPSQPRTRSFFQSVTVTKVVKPDGTVEERRTVRDGQGNEKTTVTRSGGAGTLEGPDHTGPEHPGGPHRFSDLRDDHSLFSKFFRGFK
ncbi:HCLS1-associated protein X-1 [Austrofundulus limnaeus]|uniref:HCLS1-associated protein X-1 n=1 Tax=Austrofundulus limnaeus TaxID=52670 RepID=A0A2I4CFZ6_AUSLI|nr:PREDICTED: HCLS1-associated protein X-1 [Austrofundulus limnaeus]